MTTADIKALIGITEETYDAQIALLYPEVVANLQLELNMQFDLDEDENIIIPYGLRVLVADDIKQRIEDLRDVTNQSLGDYSVGYNETGHKGNTWRSTLIKLYQVPRTY